MNGRKRGKYRSKKKGSKGRRDAVKRTEKRMKGEREQVKPRCKEF